MTIPSTLKTTGRAALGSLVLGLLGTVAALAQEAAPAAAAAAPATPAPALDAGNTARKVFSPAMVLIMTIKGLALLYGAMVRQENVLATIMQSFAITWLVTVLWFMFGYSLAFSDGGSLNKFIGGLSKAFHHGITVSTLWAPGVANIPEFVFSMFQMTFAIITPALIAGAFAERIKREGYGTTNMAPHNLVYSVIGASLLWVGWFGFNAGSELAADGLAGAAMMNTQVATAAAALAWMFAEWIVAKKPSVLGIISGAVAGLVAITPASGFVNPTGAFIIGIIAGVVCYISAVKVKHALGYDDSLDAFGVHGVGGIVGALLTGVLADPAINSLGKDASVVTQLYGIAFTILWTAIVTFVILYIVKALVGLRPTTQEEVEGLDITQHGEVVP